jgi:SAM-dependent methyltransferase
VGYGGLNLSQWHQRYRQQAGWTAQVRAHLLARANPQAHDWVLEVGSGTGAVLEQLNGEIPSRLVGLDIDRSALCFSKTIDPNINLVQANGFQMPFDGQSFAVSICHYLLLWIQSPQMILSEMRRVTRPGGSVIALAEPDYLGRIDAPPPLDRLGRMQTQSIDRQGADIQIGRKLGALFHQSGLSGIETGILGAQWNAQPGMQTDPTEWQMLASDLGDDLSQTELQNYREVAEKAQTQGTRVLFVPTFYAIGTVE